MELLEVTNNETSRRRLYADGKRISRALWVAIKSDHHLDTFLTRVSKTHTRHWCQARPPRPTPPLHDRPLASHGYNSYRFQGRYGWIMIGATSNEDALKQAARSSSDPSWPITLDNLQVWNGVQYVPVAQADTPT